MAASIIANLHRLGLAATRVKFACNWRLLGHKLYATDRQLHALKNEDAIKKSQYRWPNAIGQKKAPTHSLEMHVIRTERRAQVRPICSVFEQYEPWTEPQLNLKST
jgi:hypothetical protein